MLVQPNFSLEIYEPSDVNMDEGLDPQTKRLIERFNSLSSKSTRILSIWIPALLVLWLSGLEPRAEKIASFVDAKVAYLTQNDLVEKRNMLYKDGLLDKSNSDNKDYDKRLKKANDLKENEKKDAEETARLPIELPGGLKFAVTLKWAPTLWLALAFGAIAYLLIQRNALTRLSARVANRLVNSSLESKYLFYETLTDAPFWLAPVPRKAGQAATPDTHAAVLGWKNDYTQIVLCAFCYTVFFVIQLRVTCLTYSFVDFYGSSYEKWIIPLLSLVFCLASLAAFVDALIPGALFDSPPLEATSWYSSRRRFLINVATGTLGFSLFVTYPRLTPKILSRLNKSSPRFRLRKTNPRSEPLVTQSRGLYLNKKTKVAHYILDSGQLLGVSKINESNLVSVKFTDLKLPPDIPHAHISRASATFELIALEYVKNKNYQLACEAIMIGIRYDRIFLSKVNKGTDFRLYDLLAGIAVRHDLPNYLKELSTQLSGKKKIIVGDDKTLFERLKKWNDANSKWHKKWADKSKEILWCALPM